MNLTCPRCLGFIPNNDDPGAYIGAMSRADNHTEVCSACDQEEAMQDFVGDGPTPLVRWPVPSPRRHRANEDCPVCGAKPGQPCDTGSTHKPNMNIRHKGRAMDQSDLDAIMADSIMLGEPAIEGDGVDSDDLRWAREDIGESATEAQVYEVAQRRANERKREDVPTHVAPERRS